MDLLDPSSDDFYESDLCIPQRSEGVCPSLRHMQVAEQLQGLSYILLMFMASAHIPFIGYVALLPMIAATLGIVGMMRAIRGVVICANASSGCFAIAYLATALIFLPPLLNVCSHLAFNRKECFRCPRTATLDKCPDAFQEHSDFGMNCYNTSIGALMCSEYDDCREFAVAENPNGCYCSDNIYRDRWDELCDDGQRKYLVLIVPMSFVATSIFLVGALAGCVWGCCSPDKFSGNVAETITERSIVVSGVEDPNREIGSETSDGSTRQSNPFVPIQAVNNTSSTVQGVRLCQTMFQGRVALKSSNEDSPHQELLPSGDSADADDAGEMHPPTLAEGTEDMAGGTEDQSGRLSPEPELFRTDALPDALPRGIELEVGDAYLEQGFVTDDSGDEDDGGVDSGGISVTMQPDQAYSPRRRFENPVHPPAEDDERSDEGD